MTNSIDNPYSIVAQMQILIANKNTTITNNHNRIEELKDKIREQQATITAIQDLQFRTPAEKIKELEKRLEDQAETIRKYQGAEADLEEEITLFRNRLSDTIKAKERVEKRAENLERRLNKEKDASRHFAAQINKIQELQQELKGYKIKEGYSGYKESEQLRKRNQSLQERLENTSRLLNDALQGQLHAERTLTLLHKQLKAYDDIKGPH